MPGNKLAPQGVDSKLTVVLNTAEGPLQIAIAETSTHNQLLNCAIAAPSRGAEVLAPALHSALGILHKKADDIDRLAVVQGPGSFTGLRLAAGTAAGIARAVPAKQAGLNYLDCLARECLPFLAFAPSDFVLWILTHARRGLVYAQAFGIRPKSAFTLTPASDMLVAGLENGEALHHMLAVSAKFGATRLFLAGSGALANRAKLAEGLAAHKEVEAFFLDITCPGPQALLAAACEATYADEDIEPLYLRVSDAEADLPQIARRLGRDPEIAIKALRELTTRKD